MFVRPFSAEKGNIVYNGSVSELSLNKKRLRQEMGMVFQAALYLIL